MSTVSSTARALVAATGFLLAIGGGAYMLGSKSSAPPTAAPETSASSPGSSSPALTSTATPPSTAGWIDYTSAIYGFKLKFPAGWRLDAAATRTWLAGDVGRARPPFADSFSSPEAEPTSLILWEMPSEDGVDLDSVEGLAAFARSFCDQTFGPAGGCDAIAKDALPMCLNAGGDNCRAALIVPTDIGPTFAFFMDWTSVQFANAPERVIVVDLNRRDGPTVVPYGGALEFLTLFLTTMDVWTPGQQPAQ